jgi:hypothetical protein
MGHRRDFLKETIATAAGLGVLAGRGHSADFLRGAGEAAGLALPDVLQAEAMKPRGHTYETTVPDTFELAERARMAVTALTHLVVPETWYYDVQGVDFGPNGHPPQPKGGFDLTPKFARSLPWMRTMSGSDEFLDRQYGMMKAMLSNVRQDGLLYYPIDGNRLGNTCYPDVSGILALACDNQYQFDGNAQWLDWIRHLAAGLDRIAIRVEDRAYYPPECSIDPQGQWHWHLRGKSRDYQPPAEPASDTAGFEGSVKFEQAYVMRALVRACKYSPNADTSNLLQMLVQFCMKPGLWLDTSKEGYPGNEHGIWCCHFHGNTQPLLALLDAAELQKNGWLKEIVREAYEHAIHNGVVRMGWFPFGIGPWLIRSNAPEPSCEPDGLGEMIQLGVRLSDAGMGEYWDDVDGIVRNHLAEAQFCNLDAMRALARGGPLQDRVHEYLGGYGGAKVTAMGPDVSACCTANGSMGLYYAWHGITRYSEGVATVNLLLNRSSQWMDIDSYLPYEGKVELHNKQARTALVRVPNWVEMSAVKCFVNSRATRPAAVSRYLAFEGLRKGDTIRLEFPNPETTHRYTIGNKVYRVTFRGSTVVNIEPKLQDPAQLTLYQRDYLRAPQAPKRKVQRFVADKILPLQ